MNKFVNRSIKPQGDPENVNTTYLENAKK